MLRSLVPDGLGERGGLENQKTNKNCRIRQAHIPQGPQNTNPGCPAYARELRVKALISVYKEPHETET